MANSDNELQINEYKDLLQRVEEYLLYEDKSSMMGGLAEDIGKGKISIEEANRLINNPGASPEDIYFGPRVGIKERYK